MQGVCQAGKTLIFALHVESVAQVVQGLNFIHGRGVLHLDMKPNNIVCASRKEGDLRVKIIDFGLARNMNGSESIPITTCGTPEFMSPEVSIVLVV